MDFQKAADALKALKAPAFRLDQIRRAVFRQAISSYGEMDVLPEGLRREMSERAPILSASLQTMKISGDGRCRKALLRLKDGLGVETVLLRPSPRRWTMCISSQVGCAVGCTFCATGLMGFSRHLSPEEIWDQLLFWKQYMRREGLPENPGNVVYMGMGEPFANYDAVAQSLKVLLDQKLFGIGARHISVSTAGVAPKIERFAEDFPQVNLALSLHAANDDLRARLVPLNKAYPLPRLAQALGVYLKKTSRKVFLEYVLLSGENDRAQDAQDIAAFIDSIGPRERLHVNLIVFNRTDTPHQAPSDDEARRFQRLLTSRSVLSTLRQNLGQDIDGACGQLLAKS
ncbi:MAG: 23S rRNA (adenine(2503)-C(2))-methyltransferase RlmN [Elusimicrobiota bacterium]